MGGLLPTHRRYGLRGRRREGQSMAQPRPLQVPHLRQPIHRLVHFLSSRPPLRRTNGLRNHIHGRTEHERVNRGRDDFHPTSVAHPQRQKAKLQRSQARSYSIRQEKQHANTKLLRVCYGYLLRVKTLRTRTRRTIGQTADFAKGQI